MNKRRTREEHTKSTQLGLSCCEWTELNEVWRRPQMFLFLSHRTKRIIKSVITAWVNVFPLGELRGADIKNGLKWFPLLGHGCYGSWLSWQFFWDSVFMQRRLQDEYSKFHQQGQRRQNYLNCQYSVQCRVTKTAAVGYKQSIMWGSQNSGLHTVLHTES